MSSSDVEVHLKAYDEASSVFQSAGNNISITMTDIEGKTQSLADTTDTATSHITADMNQVSDSSASLSSEWTGLTGVGLGLAGSSMALYSSQIMLDRSNMMVESSAIAVEKAQTKYNDAVAKYGLNSEQAKMAADALALAVDRHSVAVERANRATDMFALTLGMTVVTGVATAIKVIEGLSAALFTEDAATGLTVASKIAAAAASAAHAVAEGIETAATWLLVDATASQVALLTLGIGVAVAAASVIYFMAVAHGAATQSVNNLNTALVDVNGSLEDTEKAMNVHIGLIGDFTTAINSMKDQIKANNDSLKELNDTLSVANDGWLKLHNQVSEYLLKGEKVPANLQAQCDAAQAYYESVLNETQALQDANDKLQENTAIMELNQKAAQLLFDSEISSSAAFKDSVVSSSTAIQDAFKADAGNLQAQADATRVIIQNFADQWGVTYDDAEKTLKTGVDNLISEQQKATDAQAKLLATQEADMQKHADALNTYYADKFVKPTQEYQNCLATAADKINGIMDAQNMSMGLKLSMSMAAVQNFASQWGVTWDEAEKALTSFTAATVKSIDEQLVGEAQAKFAEFQKCISGKALSLSTDVQGNIAGMAGNITDLIKNGLVGEAQTEMQNYVNCNTNKFSTMTQKIESDMKTLATQHNADVLAMQQYADTLTGQEKDGVLKQISDMTNAYQAKMQNLKDWQETLLNEMVTQTNQSFSDLADVGIKHSTRLANSLVARSIWPDMLDLMAKQTGEGLSKVEERFAQMTGKVQGAIPSGSIGAVGGIGRVGGSSANQVPVTISIGNLVNIEGSADKATADLASKQVLLALKTIMVEPTSSAAAATQKRIRSGSVFG